ncbi:MAG: GSCFA domain-containing protein [Flavobacterium sp.]
MNFTTQIPISKSDHAIDYNSRMVSLGSCFAVNIGQKLDYFKFRNITNPFGILFSPTALEKFIGFAVKKKTFTEADIFFHNERWHCYDAHSDLSHQDKDTLLANLNNAVTSTLEELKAATHIIITLGTAWVYRKNADNEIVANCHKVPQREFTKELLSGDTITQSLQNILQMISSVNTNAAVIFTVSPVRHIKDGFVENQRSKANLISALHDVIGIPPLAARGLYFPSYEIMMDELRDYRYYTSDMIHPSQTAINYIWERFTQAFVTEEAQQTMLQVDAIQKGLQHRPFNPDSAAHAAFTENILQKIKALQQQHPHILF